MVHPLRPAYSSKAAVPNQGRLQGIAYFSRSLETRGMETKDQAPDAAEGLRLVRAFLVLPAEKRRLVIALIEELARERDQREEETEASPT
jgi:hypothetical protein